MLLLEAGGWDRDPWISIPLAWPRILQRRMHDWMYFAEPEATMDGRGLECARGKVIGGSSSINAMAYVRGHRGDYQRWAATGLDTWSYAHVLPYFRRQEAWEGGASSYRGGDGPLTTRASRYPDPLSASFADAGAAAGHPTTEDYNGAQQEGFGRWQATIRDGKRCSAAVAYLRPALARPNLAVEVNALATRILIEGGRAVGIEYLRGGERISARAEREVILAGGVINSPQLLMLSGIGDPEQLRSHGITVSAALPGVGQNLQDHISAPIVWARKEPGPLHAKMRADRIAVDLAKTYFFGSGLSADLPGGVMAFLKSPLAQDLPDLQLLFVAAPMTAAPYFAPFVAPYADSFACRAVVLRPESRGRIELVSADPHAAPRIRQNFLATDKDWATLRAGLRLVREIGNQPALAEFNAGEVLPGPRLPIRRGDRHAYPGDRDHRPPPARHLQDGAAERSGGGRRSRAQSAGGRRTARRRRLGDAGPRRRQHQRAGDHDRRNGGRSDPRPDPARAGQRVSEYPRQVPVGWRVRVETTARA